MNPVRRPAFRKSVASLVVTALLTGCATAPSRPISSWQPTHLRSQVTLAETRTADVQRFRVQGAIGPDLEALQRVARVDAAAAAARLIAGAVEVQGRAERIVADSAETTVDFARPVQQLATRSAPDGENMAGDVLVDVDVVRLRRFLEQTGVVQTERALSRAAGLPRLMVLPDGASPADARRTVDRVAAGAVDSLLVRKGWELVDAQAVERARARALQLDSAAGTGVDVVAAVAMEAGAEVYVTFSVTSDGKQATVALKAVDTVGGRVLSSATGRSKNHFSGASEASIIEEAVSNAVPELVEQITARWTEALTEGRRVAIQLSGPFDGRERVRQIRAALGQLGTFDQTHKTAQSLHGTLLTKLPPESLDEELEDALHDAGITSVTPVVTSKVLLRWTVDEASE